MANIGKIGVWVALIAGHCAVGTAEAHVTAAQKCEAAKLTAAGKYDVCRLLAEARAAKTAGMPDFSKCDAAYSGKWTQAEMKANGSCLSNGDATTVQAFISQGTNALSVALAGAALPACGNGVIDAGEQCDNRTCMGRRARRRDSRRARSNAEQVASSTRAAALLPVSSTMGTGPSAICRPD
jgi:hypothetical protein